ncbi:MAG TPA: hypothetical protein VFI31_03945 [Pirellulales bacterium]|nr:hypothetical protein [Pirellulales bacterium]
MFILSLVGSNLFTSWQLGKLRDENAKLSKELGRLVISDPTKINVIAVPTYEDMLWRWRIHVPKGSGPLHLFTVTQDVPENGFPANSGSSGPFRDGEYLLTAAIRPDRNGKWQLTIAGPQSSFSMGIAEAAAAWLGDSPGYSTEQAGASGTQVADPGERLALLRIRAMKRTSPTSSSSAPGPADGVMIWLAKP